MRDPASSFWGLLLGVGAVLSHSLTRLTGQPLSLSSLAAAQLGVPVAAATVGTSLGVLAAGEAAALVLGALVTIVTATSPAYGQPGMDSSAPHHFSDHWQVSLHRPGQD